MMTREELGEVRDEREMSTARRDVATRAWHDCLPWPRRIAARLVFALLLRLERLHDRLTR